MPELTLPTRARLTLPPVCCMTGDRVNVSTQKLVLRQPLVRHLLFSIFSGLGSRRSNDSPNWWRVRLPISDDALRTLRLTESLRTLMVLGWSVGMVLGCGFAIRAVELSGSSELYLAAGTILLWLLGLLLMQAVLHERIPTVGAFVDGACRIALPSEEATFLLQQSIDEQLRTGQFDDELLEDFAYLRGS